jgi:exoribonuclease R
VTLSTQPSRAAGLLLTRDRTMLAFAKRRKEQRIARGCLTLASAEVKFEFDSETHENITDVHECAAAAAAIQPLLC